MFNDNNYRMAIGYFIKSPDHSAGERVEIKLKNLMKPIVKNDTNYLLSLLKRSKNKNRHIPPQEPSQWKQINN